MTAATTPVLGHWIGGTWMPGRSDAVSTNPAWPAQEVARTALATDAEVDAAVEAARRAAGPWARAGGVHRGRLLRTAAQALAARADELARLLVAEEGKVASEARGEIARAVDTLHYNAARALAATGEAFDSASAGMVARTIRVPVGVVAAITPWNFPVAIPVWKLAPALAHGTTVVWKPSELTPATSVLLTEILAEAGLGDGVLNLVLGDGRAGARLVAHPDVDAVTFTGSVPTGQAILASAGPRGARIQMELGGHNPAVVLDDADLDRAATAIVDGAMLSTGQKCTATRRVLVADRVHDALVERIVQRAGAVRVGDGADPDSQVGPLVSAGARERVLAAIATAVDQGATPLVGEQHADGGRPPTGGHFVAPTVLGVASHDLDICHTEVFGPVTSVLRVADDDEAYALANATAYGLSAAVHTQSAARARHACDVIDAGLITVNGPTTGADLHVPFGGVKASSGPGPREMGEAAREFFTTTRTVYLDARLAL